jgi:tRNA acetyltransferase TAN1
MMYPGHMTNNRRLQFCVRPNMRNHNTLKRDAIIKTIAGLVGQPHRVDLKNYDLLITVEIYKVGSLTMQTASHRRRMLR